jgi:glutamyl-tRNA reductase
MILGETEVLGQIKRAYDKALRWGSTSRHLNKLFQYAFRVAKTVRSETRITRGPTSIGAAVVELAEKIFNDLEKCRIMILGAGETSKRTARSLISRGVQSTIVSNRTYERAAHLAAEVGGEALHFAQWQNAFSDVDILISSTSAPYPILTSEQLSLLMKKRRQRPVFIIDLAVPRDVEASASNLDSVFLYDIDSLQDIAQQSINVRHCELKCCEALIEEHVRGFVARLHRSTWEDAHGLLSV